MIQRANNLLKFYRLLFFFFFSNPDTITSEFYFIYMGLMFIRKEDPIQKLCFIYLLIIWSFFIVIVFGIYWLLWLLW